VPWAKLLTDKVSDRLTDLELEKTQNKFFILCFSVRKHQSSSYFCASIFLLYKGNYFMEKSLHFQAYRLHYREETMGSGSISRSLFLAFPAGLAMVSFHSPVHISLICQSKTERAIIIKSKYRWQYSKHNKIQDRGASLLKLISSGYGGAWNM